MMATRRSSPVADRRQEIVEAAFHDIAEKGFEGLRLRGIAGAVGLDHSTLHHYFPTKEDLIAAVVEYATSRFWTSRGDSPTTLREHLRMVGRMIRDQPELFAVLRELDLRAARDPAVGAIVAASERGWQAALTERLTEAGFPHGKAASPEKEGALAVSLIIAAIKGISLRPQTAPDVLALLERLLVK